MIDLSKLDGNTWALLAFAFTLAGNIVLSLVNKRTPSADNSLTAQQQFYAKVMDENQQLRVEAESADKDLEELREANRLLRERNATVTRENERHMAKAGELEQALRDRLVEIAQKDREITKLLRKNAGLNGHTSGDDN